MATSNRANHPTATGDKESNGTTPTSALFTIRVIPGKGKGMISSQSIAPGTCIVKEQPLLTTAGIMSLETQERDLATTLKSLPRESQRAFLMLHNNRPGKEPLSNIVRSNAYPLGPSSGIGAIFPTIARINHSCRPNAQHAWNEAEQKETVHAVRRIEAGDEITLSYSAGGPSRERREKLKDFFLFDCMCELCSLPPDQLKVSDNRLQKAQQLDEAIGNPKRVMLTPEKALADCHALEGLYTDEGIADTRMPRLYFDAFQICIMHADQARARVFAQRSREARILCEGKDSTEAAEMAALAVNPSAHENFAATSKWKLAASQVPKDLDVDSFEQWLWRQAK